LDINQKVRSLSFLSRLLSDDQCLLGNLFLIICYRSGDSSSLRSSEECWIQLGLKLKDLLLKRSYGWLSSSDSLGVWSDWLHVLCLSSLEGQGLLLEDVLLSLPLVDQGNIASV
jgi:hypothetical protein